MHVSASESSIERPLGFLLHIYTNLFSDNVLHPFHLHVPSLMLRVLISKDTLTTIRFSQVDNYSLQCFLFLISSWNKVNDEKLIVAQLVYRLSSKEPESS
jgi:hypothetical protein